MPARARVLAALLVIWVLVPPMLFVARWPSWWTWIAPEQTPMTWLQSVVLVLAAAACLLVGWLSVRLEHPHTRAWWLLAGAFAALTLDERFAVHERVRDGFLAPRRVSVPLLPWVAPGDFLMLAVATAGLLALPTIVRAVRPEPWALRALVTGVVLGAAAVGLDSIDPSTWSVAAERAQQSAEEVIELGSGLALLGAMTFRLLGLLELAVEGSVAGLVGGQPTGAVAGVGNPALPLGDRSDGPEHEQDQQDGHASNIVPHRSVSQWQD